LFASQRVFPQLSNQPLFALWRMQKARLDNQPGFSFTTNQFHNHSNFSNGISFAAGEVLIVNR
jgi:hypothetical protein